MARRKKSYEYKLEPRKLTQELLELENLNRSTSLEIKTMHNSHIAIIGCGPVGMATGLWLKKVCPNIDIAIYFISMLRRRYNINVSKFHII